MDPQSFHRGLMIGWLIAAASDISINEHSKHSIEDLLPKLPQDEQEVIITFLHEQTETLRDFMLANTSELPIQ